MRVGVIQSSYVPWRGYFDFIRSVDVFVFYDDVQYSSGSWRNRNQLKTATGLKWLTVPVKRRFGQAIDETEIEYAHPWQEQNRGLLKASLGRAPFYADASALWERGVADRPDLLSRLNVSLTKLICDYLGISTRLEHSRSLNLTGARTERLISLLTRLGARTYLSGPSAASYLDLEKFREAGIRLEYKSYDYVPYPQQWGEFAGTVSVLDLIANAGSRAGEYLNSTTPDIVVVP